ncbi:Asp-tRNA(Asn)/Glu-tRNA(Gln) amidotransferase subunit GatB [Patescibacteria group bacterium]|nr:Asp-tRNA(Asn)/Glu-tRNA(Gln) amidotransferase subunit GatB [Patescibacteria group bacterium]MDE1946825.1 Asp-tRNA(Asn)/Glu-tRNA(Gln) amidotransferase subunit GatB [Patescibacteria group bacterium]MDE2011189.1 Asp-tRNA(Asn)/Glu-tRNA(Gln) amidotransferase subunit GatB [Patescibacteria group bacterium]MDE2233502.1 Asp-tRNA(Asn)/Glu-tRNA(Gln) amidotransferase subunit GatB [Patescibacteria group bacterium]
MEYLPTIGLEIHAELATASKMFCSCKNDPDEECSNTNVCPICLGHPGTLPVLNREAIGKVLSIGVAVNGTPADFTEWDRKQYFYPDIPKGYQISQYAYPLVSGGALAGVELERIHLEEDTAQSTHGQDVKGRTSGGDVSLIDFNRSGVPLMELVTKPVIHDAATAVQFAKELQLLLRYLGAGEANMEKGEMRVEANVSVAAGGVSTANLGTKTEVKNLNSFRAVERAIEYEIDRQIKLLEKGEKVVQETRGWDDRKGVTFSQRSKESAHDYRYFPEPDIPKMMISEIPEFSHESLSKNLPELPWDLRDRSKRDYGATDKEAEMFVEDRMLADYFEEIVKAGKGFKVDDKKFVRLALNYLLTDYLGALKKKNSVAVSGACQSVAGDNDSAAKFSQQIPPKHWAELIGMIINGELSSRGAKDTLAEMIEKSTESPRKIAETRGLLQQNDAEALEKTVRTVLDANKSVVEEFKAGKKASLQYLIGQVMKETRGSANPAAIPAVIEKLIYGGLTPI